MKILLSTAKTMDFSNTERNLSDPAFLDKSGKIADKLKKMKIEDLMTLMKISESISGDVWQNYQKWNISYDNVCFSSALSAYSGAVFQTLDFMSLNAEDIAFSQETLRIVCGLYGLLKPLDRIMPYRLEMGTRLSVNGKKNLYEFWKSTLTSHLSEELKLDNLPCVVNLASSEFSKALNLKKLEAPVVTPLFKECKGDQLKTVAIFAKQARGAMARFIVKNRITDSEKLKAFEWNGYGFESENKNEWLFVRPGR